ncbi:MAG: multifunctional CCA tRNA nucleotidyl transferase/2'3'-cyclic phosphodiesterase/2'nucleotidase/phosphatase, partial [Methylomonas sp.]|nr:multifunctional CCA tRNA nucleotidyl transferase/2'3'-cyclic phosphodiesterase/2'nucleotidase/phosphatase [Methylomonas sp.]
LQAVGAFKSAEQLQDFLAACEADARGRTGFEEAEYPQAEYIKKAAQTALAVDTRQVLQDNLRGAQIGAAIQKLRSQAVNSFKQQYTLLPS